MLSERVNRIALSPTLRITARALQMRAQGVDVVDFSVGEPDFPTPEAVRKAAKAALDAGFTKYTANDGIPDLKAAICEKLEHENNLRYSPDEILVSPGAKNDLFNLALALFEPGDDVLIPRPCWVSYPDQVRLAGANPVTLPTREEDDFRLQAKDLAASITPNTKALILNYPCNPTGAVYSREDLEAIAEVCVREQIWVIADEIYEKLLYDGRRFVSIGSLNEKIKKLTVVINGFSKAFAMTGWRLGYMAGPKEVVSACAKIQSHNTSNATSFVQKAAVEALRSCSMEVERMRQEFERRRNGIVYRLNAIPGVSCVSPPGAFYVLPNVGRYLKMAYQGAPIRNTYGLAYYLLKEAAVAVVPGEAFMAEEHLRLSFATSMDRIEEGMRRIDRALRNLEEPVLTRPTALNNVVTKVQEYVQARPAGGMEQRNELAAFAEANLPADEYFEWNAAIGGAVVQLRTNSPHLADFYQENFFPAPLESEVDPHAVVYAVKDAPGREPSALLSVETGTAFQFNTAFYGQTRSLALALASEAAARATGSLLAHCAALDAGGRGALVWGTPGTGRTSVLAAALRASGVRLVASDAAMIRFTAGGPVADLAERKLYLKASWVRHLPEVEKLLFRSKTENMVTSRDQCRVEYCQTEDQCPLDRGGAFCPMASPRGRILVDPYWLGGATRHVRRTAPVLCALVVRDPALPATKEMEPREALRMLSEGLLPGSRGTGASLLNPHLEGTWDMTRADRVRGQHERLFAATRVILINNAGGSPEAAADRLLHALA